MAFIPEELISSYNIKKPEIRMENDIVELLEREKLSDDMKVKLLGQLIMRYQKTVHEPAKPMRVTVVKDEKERLLDGQPSGEENKNTPLNTDEDDIVMNDIFASAPRNFWKFIPMIVQKLKTRNYSWNDMGEMTVDSVPIKHSSIADFFSHLLRNKKTQKEPPHFDEFVRALREINLPTSWVGNKIVLQRLKPRVTIPLHTESPDMSDSSNQEETPILPTKRDREFETSSSLSSKIWKKY